MSTKLDPTASVGINSKEIDTSKEIPKKKKIKKLPKIKDVKLVSIEIGSKYIKLIEAKKKRDSIHVNSAVKIEAPKETSSNGELHNLPNIAAVLKNTLSKRHISTKNISFTGISNNVISREITILDSDEISLKERQMLVENEIKQYLLINLEDYKIQFTDAGRFEEDGVKKMKVLVIAYPNKLIENYLTIIEGLGSKYKPCSLDVTNNSLQKVFKHINTINGKEIDKEKVYLFIDMGAESFNTSIINNRKLEFMRLLSGGGSEIDKQIAFKIGMTIEDAESEKIEKCNLMADELVGVEKDVNKAIRDVVNGWIDEIERIIQFYNNKEQKRIEKIYLYGGGSRLRGVSEFIQERLNIETEKIKSFDGVQLDKRVNIHSIDQFISTLGTVIRF